ncbi:MAG TPA: biotin/lipoyl-containing protein [Candidatus Limnocylindrales bacterium]|nr:biotin/lipoyl-containing protein [Candidatus Limnocylindrales bacterium]
MTDEATAPAPESAPAAADVAPADAARALDAAPAASPEDASLLALIDRLSALLEQTELTELEVQVGDTGLVLRKPSALAPMVAAPVGVAGAAPADGAAAPAPAATPAADVAAPARPAVMAPLTGIWYASPAPGSAPYVNLGGEVAVGQIIGLIEAMKLFNEIKSDKAGRVVKINAESGKLVRAKQPLIEVDPL